MSTLAPAKPPDQREQRAAPPDEQFWVRYSPHYEGPLSGVGSFVIHALVLGIIAMVCAIPFINRNQSNVPIDSVTMDPGPGGKPSGNAQESGKGKNDDQNPEDKEKLAKKVPATLPSTPEPRPFLEDLKDRYIEGVIEQNNEAIKNILSMPKTTAHGIHEGLTAKDGGDGEKEIGKGTGKGDGKGTLSIREQRMLRWTMSFDIRNGEDYAKQLGALGVFIAIEIPDVPDTVRVYKDLRPDSEGKETKLKDITRMPWIDGRKESVNALCTYMGIESKPPRIIAYMTKEMETNLLKMELKAAGDVEEDKIKETVFKIVKRGDKYEPVVASQRK